MDTREHAPVCKGGNPGGLSLDDVNLVLHRLPPYSDGGDLPLRSENHDADRMNDACDRADKAAGRPLKVPQNDLEALEALLAWKP